MSERTVQWRGGPHDGHMMVASSDVLLPELISAPGVFACEVRYYYRLAIGCDGVVTYDYAGSLSGHVAGAWTGQP